MLTVLTVATLDLSCRLDRHEIFACMIVVSIYAIEMIVMTCACRFNGLIQLAIMHFCRMISNQSIV